MRQRLLRAPGQPELEKQLLKDAEELGISLYGAVASKREEWDTAELQRRVEQAKRDRRSARLWWVALLSGIASALSALAAWTAVLLAMRRAAALP